MAYQNKNDMMMDGHYGMLEGIHGNPGECDVTCEHISLHAYIIAF